MSVASHLGKRSAVVGGAADGECGGGTAGTAREREADRIERGSGGEEETQADDAHITTTSMREVAECRQRAGGSADTPIRSVLAGSSGGGGDGRRTRSATTAEKAEEGRKCHQQPACPRKCRTYRRVTRNQGKQLTEQTERPAARL